MHWVEGVLGNRLVGVGVDRPQEEEEGEGVGCLRISWLWWRGVVVFMNCKIEEKKDDKGGGHEKNFFCTRIIV